MSVNKMGIICLPLLKIVNLKVHIWHALSILALKY